MLNSKISDWLTLSGGVRYEGTRMNIANHDTITDTLSGEIIEDDFLPAINGKFRIKNNMNFRLAYGKTIARPSLREMAPFASQDFPRGNIFNGNPDLKRSTVHKGDIRWEWFRRTGEVIAISGFYKYFNDPIQKCMSFNKNITELFFYTKKWVIPW